jgi:predicted AlkP superfamily phosphohydrolase/phosphomutase
MTKVLLIILDGVRFDLIEKWAKEGMLPNMESMIRHGVSGNLQSIFPIHTMLAFSAMITGKNPGKTGIYDMQLQKPGTYKTIVPNSTNIKSKTIFELLSEAGKTVGSINIPLTYPPQPVNGVTVCSWLTPPFANYTYPKEVAKTLNDMGYRIQPDDLEREHPKFEEEVYDVTEKRFGAAKWFMQNHDWSFVSVLVVGTEHMHHNYAAFMDPKHPDHGPEQEAVVKKYYSFVDENIGEMFKLIDEDTVVFVISDHGFGPSYGELYLNTVLQKYDYFTPKRKFSLTRKIFEDLESSGIANKLRNVIKFDLFKLMPEKIKNFISENRAISVNADWENTKAYCTGILGGIRINLVGREPGGIVKKENYEKVRSEISEALKNDEDIGHLVRKVWKREELYSGPYLENIPDLVVELDKCYTTSPETPDRLTGKWKKVGFHTLQGLFLARGRDIKSYKRVDAKIVDITPTILHILGAAVPDDVDGKVLKEMFREYSDIVKREVSFQKSGEKKVKEVERSAEDEEAAKERLRALGYI